MYAHLINYIIIRLPTYHEFVITMFVMKRCLQNFISEVKIFVLQSCGGDWKQRVSRALSLNKHSTVVVWTTLWVFFMMKPMDSKNISCIDIAEFFSDLTATTVNILQKMNFLNSCQPSKKPRIEITRFKYLL